jgi:hypothetical protein
MGTTLACGFCSALYCFYKPTKKPLPMNALTTQNNNKAANNTGDITLQLVTFRLVEEDFGVPILDVREIILMLKNQGKTVFFNIKPHNF